MESPPYPLSQTPLWNVGKYLLPRDLHRLFLRGTVPATRQSRVEELAATTPEQVTLTQVGEAEGLPQFDYPSLTEGLLQHHSLKAQIAPAAWVARLQNGRSVGRHCIAMTSTGEAIQETGFNFSLAGGSKFTLSRRALRNHRFRREGDLTLRRSLPRIQHVSGRVATLNTVSSHNFYHWMVDILPRYATLHRAGFMADYYLVDCQSSFQRRVLGELGIAESQLIQPHCGLTLEADQLLVPSKPSPECQRHLGRMLADKLLACEPASSAPCRRLFISRRQAATRRLANETEFDVFLNERGFETHCFENYDLAEQCRLISEADTIVATHGAGLANLQFAKPGTRVIEIVPEGRFNSNCYPTMSRTFGLDHQILFAKKARHKQILTVSLADAAVALAAQVPQRNTIEKLSNLAAG
ncbi:glycosyltransferase family 61 protein [Adhaeretor mobilis]|uniref:Glycosyltransferase 61 catalytic domain-containing protein n=1 Tax=Adhaeretor mobilis TaxID=1930276 RepID=A0A517N349_9BACT|nr:glycosyltransferase family 61 protein [Adhaeretor mobilis]QDT01562.1 hypothetical protein HG15A2_49090 [Adhaeretor mobilis]